MMRAGLVFETLHGDVPLSIDLKNPARKKWTATVECGSAHVTYGHQKLRPLMAIISEDDELLSRVNEHRSVPIPESLWRMMVEDVVSKARRS